MNENQPLIGIFDAGVGGFPVAADLSAMGYRIVYLGDSGRRPYGPQPNDVVCRYVEEAERFFFDAGCDLWVIACNTASVVAREALHGLLPCVDMVTAVVAALATEESAFPIGLLATAGTVASGEYPRALESYELHQVATEELLRLAEEGGGDAMQVQELAAAAFEELREHGCRTAILACTDFTCVLDDLLTVSGDLKLIDPVGAAAQLVTQLAPLHGAKNGAAPDHRIALTGPHPLDVRAYAESRFGLRFPTPELVQLS